VLLLDHSDFCQGELTLPVSHSTNTSQSVKNLRCLWRMIIVAQEECILSLLHFLRTFIVLNLFSELLCNIQILEEAFTF
jgi:hypothetical protein